MMMSIRGEMPSDQRFLKAMEGRKWIQKWIQKAIRMVAPGAQGTEGER